MLVSELHEDTILTAVGHWVHSPRDIHGPLYPWSFLASNLRLFVLAEAYRSLNNLVSVVHGYEYIYALTSNENRGCDADVCDPSNPPHERCTDWSVSLAVL